MAQDNTHLEDIDKDCAEVVEEARSGSILMKTVIAGLAGSNVGIDTNLPTFNQYTHGVSKARYKLIGADSGVGKTTLVDTAYLLEPILYIMQLKDIIEQNGLVGLTQREIFTMSKKLKFNYWSFEISKEMKFLKWAVYLLWKLFNIRVSTDYLAGTGGQGKIASEVWSKLRKVDKIITHILDEYVIIFDEVENPTGIYKYLKQFAESNGKFIKEDYKIGIETKSRIIGYNPKDPNLLVENIFDHLALLSLERGFTTKQNMDKLSEYLVYFRNRCGYSSAVVQQFNNNLTSIDRQKLKAASLCPQRSDFGDSTYTFRDADIVWGLFKPTTYDLEYFQGYKILPSTPQDKNYLGDTAIFSHLLKNRYGKSNIVANLYLDGLVGEFKELPDASEFNSLMASYGDYVPKPNDYN